MSFNCLDIEKYEWIDAIRRCLGFFLGMSSLGRDCLCSKGREVGG